MTPEDVLAFWIGERSAAPPSDERIARWFAADPELRWRASSGGVASALGLFALEQAGMHGVLHVAARPDAPWRSGAQLGTSSSSG